MSINQSLAGGSIRATMVVGGSGYIGRNLVRRLSECHEPVVSVYHKRLPEPLPHVYPVCSDLDSVDLLAAPLRGVETVYFLAWQNSFLGSNEHISFQVDVESCSPNLKMLKNLISAMEKADTKRVIFLSALGANRQAETPFLKEKYIAEYAILNSRIREKVIIRTSLVCDREGFRDPFVKSILKVMKFPGLYPVPNHKNKVAPVHIDDLVNVLFRMNHHKVSEKASVLEITGEEKLMVGEIFKLVSDRFVKGAKIQLRGALGNSLLPVFERKTRVDETLPKIRDYLAIGCEADQHTCKENSLNALLPQKFKTFHDSLRNGQKSD